MADGSFIGNRLKLGLSIKDYNLLEKFYKFIDSDNSIRHNNISCEFSVMDSYTIPLLREKFGINPRKTYYPPKTLLWMEPDLMYSFIIGFIDGDGSIGYQYKRSDVSLRIKIHKNWLYILNEISVFLSKKSNVPIVKAKINNQGYANINLTNHILLKSLKNKILELKLPYLKRKWDVIDENHINKNEQAKINLENVKHLMSLEYSNKMISEKLDMKPATIYMIQKRNGLK